MSRAMAVVVVTFDARAHVGPCLDALEAAAPGMSLDVVVVDNASKDGTCDIVRTHRPAVRMIQNPTNRGFAAAANQGARAVGGDAVLFLNPDAVLAAGALARLGEALFADHRAGLAGACLHNPDGSPQPSAWPAPSLASFAYDALLLRNLAPRSRHHFTPFPPATAEADTLCGACLLVRRACLEDVGGFDEGFFLYHEDLDLCLRARRRGWRALLVPGARATHVLGGSAFRDRGRFWARYHESRRRLVREHFRGVRRAALLGLHDLAVINRMVADGLRGWLAGDRTRRAEAAHHLRALRRLHGRARA